MDGVNPYNFGPVVPDRTVYNVANTVSDFLPGIGAGLSAAWTQGNRRDKFNAGSDTLVNLLVFQGISRLYNKLLDKLYQTHPGLAEKVNQHPILMGIPTAIAGFLIASFGGNIVTRLFQMVKGVPTVDNAINRGLYSRPGNTLARLLGPVNKLLNKGLVKAGIIGTGIAFFGYYLFRSLTDSMAFGKAYNQARKDIPMSEMSPYELKAQVGSQLVRSRKFDSLMNAKADNPEPAIEQVSESVPESREPLLVTA